MEKIDELRSTLKFCTTVEEIMGVEGNIRKIYYETWNYIINQNILFDKRVKNPPDNSINSIISYLNTLCYTKVLSQIYMTKIDPTISYLHEPSEKRFSLCLDISEIFKPIIVDRLIFSMFNKNHIKSDDFEKGLNYVYIKDKARMEITKQFDLKLQQTIKHKKFGRDVTYEYLIRLEIYKLIKYLTEDIEYDGFKMWW